MKKFSFILFFLAVLLMTSCTKSNLKKWADGCSSGDSESCINAANYYANRDQDESFRYFNKACQLDSAEGCTESGLHYILLSKNVPKALEQLQKSCSLDASKKGCWWIGSIYSHGLLVQVDKKISLENWLKGCDAGETESCMGMAELFKNGEGVPKDLAKAQNIYKFACKKNDMNACINYEEISYQFNKVGAGATTYQQGLRYENGDGVPKNQNQALTLFNQACNNGFPQACSHLGSIFENNDFNKSFAFYDRACNIGDPVSCSKAGILILYKAQNNQKNQQLARDYLQKACSAGEKSGCSTLEYFSLSTNSDSLDYNKIAQDLDKSCRTGDYKACYWLGTLLNKGLGVKKNLELANKLFDFSCKNNIAEACQNVKKVDVQQETNSNEKAITEIDTNNSIKSTQPNSTENLKQPTQVDKTISQPKQSTTTTPKVQKTPTKKNNSAIDDLF